MAIATANGGASTLPHVGLRARGLPASILDMSRAGALAGAWACAHDALQAAGARASHLDARKVPKLDGDEPGPAACCFAAAEIAYRACGSQLFYSPSAAFVALVAAAPAARAPDGVQPSDFVALLVPPGTGVNLDAFVWHAPPILTGPARATRTR